MCLPVPKTKDPQLPREYSQMKQPDEGKVRSDSAARMGDKLRSASSILTSSSGVKDFAATEKKTLLGA